LPIRVFLISDFSLLLKYIEGMLGAERLRFALAGVATSCVQATEAVRQAKPDVVLLDLDGEPEKILPLITALRSISAAKILVLTRLDNIALQDEAVLVGARGVVDRSTAPEMLLTAIEKVQQGQIWLDRTATGRIFVELSRVSGGKGDDEVADKLSMLTAREQNILASIASNSSDAGKIISAKLHISESTLRNHLTSIYEKLGVTNRSGLLAYVFQNDLLKRLVRKPGTIVKT
jgi:two-component system, NarL family, nitrate/nitrite response regulator NarL